MAHTYMLFDFGADEVKAQQARHKLEGWKQAFRLDKKLQFKFDRGEPAVTPALAAPDEAEEAEKPAKSAKGGKAKGKPATSKPAAKAAKAADATSAAPNGDVKLLVRLYFSPHEKLSEQRWLDRIPAEEPFRNASPKIVQEGAEGFSDALAYFDRLD